jgi:hypothetical protein
LSTRVLKSSVIKGDHSTKEINFISLLPQMLALKQCLVFTFDWNLDDITDFVFTTNRMPI